MWMSAGALTWHTHIFLKSHQSQLSCTFEIDPDQIDLPLTHLWFTWWFPSEPKSNQVVRLIWSKSSRFPAVVAVERTERVWSDYFWLNRRIFSAGLRGGGNVHEKTADRSLWHRMHCLSSLCHLICHSVALILTLHMSSYPRFACIFFRDLLLICTRTKFLAVNGSLHSTNDACLIW